MRTNVVLDDDLMKEALKFSKEKTKKGVIQEALRAFIASHKRRDLRDLIGQDLIDPEYDYKALREGR